MGAAFNTRSDLDRFAREVAGRAQFRRNIHIITDFDGTIAVPAANPAHTKCEPALLRVLHEIAGYAKATVTIATGRSVEDIRHRMRSGNQAFLPFHLIGSDGSEHQLPMSRQIVKAPLPAGSQSLMDEFNRVAADLEQRNPGLVVEQKHGGVRISANGMDEKDRFKRRNVISEARALFAKICSDPAMPKVNGEAFFQIRQDTGDDIYIRPAGFDKAFAISRIQQIDPRWDTVIFLGDSLGAHGNDRSAAALLNDRKQYPNGTVMQVWNNRDGPIDPASPEAPQFVLKDPEDAGYFLSRLALYMRKFSPQLRNFPPPRP
jgi:HAD superfamily hydrolase (TIGR01484 family)